MKKFSCTFSAKKARMALAALAVLGVMGGGIVQGAGVFEGTKWEETKDQAVHDAALNHDNDNDFKYREWANTKGGLALTESTFWHAATVQDGVWTSGGHNAECGNADKYYASLKAVQVVAKALYNNDVVIAEKIAAFSELNKNIKDSSKYTASLKDKNDTNSGTVVGALNAMYDIASSKANPDMDNLTDAGKMNVKKLAQDAIDVQAGSGIKVDAVKTDGKTTYTISATGAGGAGNVVVAAADNGYATVSSITDGGTTTYSVNVKAEGQVASGNTGLVTGNTVYEAINTKVGDNQYTSENYVAKGDSSTAAISKLDAQLKATDDKVGDNQYTSANYVAKGDSSTAAISKLDAQLKATDDKVGDNQYTSANYVAKGDSSTAAISKLDAQLKTTDDKVTAVEGKLTTLDNSKANKDLDNLSEAGTTKVKELAQDAIDVKGAENGPVTVNSETKGGKKTFTVSVATDGQVAENDTGIVTGGTVYAVTNTLAGKIDNEAAAREAGDANLQTAIDTVDTKVGDNKYTSTNYVSAGQSSTAAISALDSGLANEAAAREAADIALGSRINKLDSRIGKVGAGAAALAALHPLDFDRENKLSFAAGYGNYAGENAAAVGGFYRPNENVMFSVAGTMGNGENMVNAGVSFALGSGSHFATSKSAMAEKIKAQDEQIQAQNERIEAMDAEIAELKAMLQQLASGK